MHGWIRTGLLAASGIGLLALVGCASMAKPTLPVSLSARGQQRRAVRFDPYPQDDIGPYLFREPLMDGTRPRDYNEPVAEIRRSRWWGPVR